MKLAFLFCVSSLAGTCSASSLPVSIASRVSQVEQLFNGPISTACRVELMIVAPGVFTDPPPDETSFHKVANVTISVDALSSYEFVRVIIKNINASKWEATESFGYPRWYWRIVDPSGRTIIGLLVDEENSAIRCEKIWYTVDRTLVHRLTREFVNASITTFLPIESHKAVPQEPTKAR